MSQGCTPELSVIISRFFIMYFVSKVDKPGDLLQNSQEHFPPAEVYFKWRQADGITGELLLQSQLYLLFCNSDFKTSDISCLCPSLSTPRYNTAEKRAVHNAAKSWRPAPRLLTPSHCTSWHCEWGSQHHQRHHTWPHPPAKL